ncbi:hypothetical protein N8I74_17335 [Chitiniphilus purpureus]|uniref:Esterase n=1 Tax=Chitiniphilus purpureus TaxID=2981137 RepID=A0ABY6DL32_9NEIS|nr:YqiA/YcfP family alpha/beta fold hydrolase [Chitiniphilus sp. CD1]UXY15055.1 hypothetical protein N8I74_17335 [Chitiniphilus sp. CD1]
MTHLVYLHGFLSSPFSRKAQATAVWMAEQGLSDYFHCPQIALEPEEAANTLRQLLDKLKGERLCFVGSSLGGYLATWLVEEHGGRAVLINPAVRPYASLQHYLGPQRNYHTGEVYLIDECYAGKLRAFERTPSDPAHYWVLVETGDEVLDYREALAAYPGSRQTVIEGGDHSFQDYTRWLPAIWDFAQET